MATKASSDKSPPTEVQVYLCAKCEYWSHNKYYLKQHVDLVHNAERVYKCPFCDYAGKRSHSLKEHLVVHSNYRPYVCSQCNASFRKKGHLTNHIKMHSSYKDPGQLSCPVCMRCNFDNLLGLHIHLREKHATEIYSCDVCLYATVKNAANITMHMMTHESPKIFTCKLCTFSALHEEIIAEHISSDHLNQVDDTDKRDIIQVQPTLLPDKQITQGAKIWLKCTECGFVTDKKEILKAHMNNHLEVVTKKVKDKIKNYTEGNLKMEELNAIIDNQAKAKNSNKEKTLHECPKCNFSTGELTLFLKHMVNHNKQEDPEPSCSKQQAVNTKPKVQNEKASNEKPYTYDESNKWYQCTLCGYLSEQQRTIKAHIWKHSGHKDLDYPMFQSGEFEMASESKDQQKSLAIQGVETVKKEAESKEEAMSEQVKVEKDAAGKVEDKKVVYVNMDAGIAMTNTEFANQIPLILRQINAISGEYRLVQMHQGKVVNELTVKLEKESGNEKVEEATSTGQANVHEEARPMDTSGNLVIDEQHFDVHEEIVADHSTEPPLKKRKLEGSSDVAPSSAEGIIIKDVVSLSPNIATECPLPEMAAEVSIGSSHLSPKAVLSTDLTSSSDDDSQLSGSFDHSDAEVINLLSLLKKGPIRRQISEQGSSFQEDEDSRSSLSSNHQRQGISNSLLAVIEQLRERTNKDTDEEVQITSVKSVNKRKKAKKILKSEATPNGLNIETTDGGYRCLSCFYTHPSLEAVKIHMKLHQDKQPFECSLCEYKGHSSEDLQDHMLQHCKLRTYQCDMCSAVFNFKSQLRAHISAHPMACSKCDYETTDPTQFRLHVQTHESHENMPQKLYVCQKCSITFNQKEAAEAHPKNCPGGAEKFGKRVIGKRQYKCEYCPAIAHTQAILKAHMRTHDVSQTLQCDLCGFLAFSVRSLKSHMKRHINDQRFVQQPLEQYKCNLCGYVCHHLPSLKSHMWRHANDKNYNYEEINAIINRALEYDEPESESSKVEEQETDQTGHLKYLIMFRCCQCGFESVRKSALNAHMKSHMDIIQKTLEVNQEKLAAGKPVVNALEREKHFEGEINKSNILQVPI